MNSFSGFIARNVSAIVDEFEVYARTSGRGTELLSSMDLRDHAQVVLEAVSADMATAQSASDQHAKSIGGSAVEFSEVKRTSRMHAQHRFGQGFTMPQMLSEYRALRASVIRLWRAQLTNGADAVQLDELTRFGEAVDEGVTEAISWYTKRLEDSRNLLIGVLAHDLRAPLDAAQMSAQYLLNAEPLTDTQLRATARITRATARMAGYISDLLDFTQTLLGGSLPVLRTRVDLPALASAAVDELSAAHPSAKVRLDVEGLPSGNWDMLRLAQLLSNLGTNAILHGDLSQPVVITVIAGEGEAIIKVHNEGEPIPSDRLPTLFQPLMQLRRPHPSNVGPSGLGLGLYIAREIATAHGGSIAVDSDAARGTTFVVKLPLG